MYRYLENTVSHRLSMLVKRFIDLKTRFFVIIRLAFAFAFMTLLLTHPVRAEEPQNAPPSWRGGPVSGFSLYTGIIGGELIHKNIGMSMGMPACIGIKYYFDDLGYRWFVGAHATYLDVNDDETKDGVRYTSVTDTLAGAGFGYKWRWKNHWELCASISLTYEREEYKNDTSKRTIESLIAFPGLTFGYCF
jgi:hypothetical protein